MPVGERFLRHLLLLLLLRLPNAVFVLAYDVTLCNILTRKPPQSRRLIGVVDVHVSMMAITYNRPLLCPAALLIILEAVTFAAILPDNTAWFGAHWCSLFPVHHTSIVLAVRNPLTVDQSLIFAFDGEDLKLTPPVRQSLRKKRSG